MRFDKPLSILKDRLGNSYIGIKFTTAEIYQIADKLKEYLGEEYDLYASNRVNRDGENYHITVLNVPEYEPVRQNAVKHLGEKFYVEIVGIGKAEGKGNTTYFAIVTSPVLESFAKMFTDNKKDFHITLGFDTKDVFGVSKGIDSKILDI